LLGKFVTTTDALMVLMRLDEAISKRNGLVLLCAVVGTVLILLTTWRYGPGLTPDSVIYLSAAQNIFEGRGYSSFFDKAFGS